MKAIKTCSYLISMFVEYDIKYKFSGYKVKSHVIVVFNETSILTLSCF